MKRTSLKRIFIAVFVLVLLLFAAPSAFAQETDNWITKAPMITSRSRFQTQVVNGKIYALGGWDDASIGLAAMEVYDPAFNTWVEKSSMSTQRIEFQTEVIDGKIYAIGGWVETFSGENEINELSSVEEYDPETDTWTAKAPMHAPRSSFLSEVINGKIYAIGGVSNGSSLEEYDPVSDTWTTKAAMLFPKSIYNQQTAVLNGKIYSIGETVEEYSPASNTWTVKAPMHESRYKFQTEIIDGKIYAIGGYGKSSELSTVEEYDPASDTWTKKKSMPTPRMELQTEVIDGKIYAAGGYGQDAYLSVVEEYNPAADTWKILNSMSSPRSWYQTEVLGKKIYVIGGSDNISVSTEEYTVPQEFNSTGAAIAIVSFAVLGLLLLKRILKRLGINVLPAIQSRIKMKPKSCLLLLCVIGFSLLHGF